AEKVAETRPLWGRGALTLLAPEDHNARHGLPEVRCAQRDRRRLLPLLRRLAARAGIGDHPGGEVVPQARIEAAGFRRATQAVSPLHDLERSDVQVLRALRDAARR